MAEENKNGVDGNNIDGVLKQLRESYSDNSESADVDEASQDGFDDISHDELQERLKSQFLTDKAESTEKSTDEYVIDEDFLSDAYSEDGTSEDVKDEESVEYVEEAFDGDQPEEKIEENEYGFDREISEEDEEDALEETVQEEIEGYQEAPIYQGSQEIQEEENYEEYQEDPEVGIYEGSSKIKEEEYYQAFEEIYEKEEDKEIQESFDQSLQLNEEPSEEDYDFEDEGEYEEEVITEEIDSEEYDPRRASEENYIGMFYQSGEYDPYDNMSFKEKIVETAPTVDELEATLNAHTEEEFTLDDFDEFDEIEALPLILEEDEPIEAESEEKPVLDGKNVEIDKADIALLLEFGYRDEVLENIPNENIEKLSNEALDENIPEDTSDESSKPEKKDDQKSKAITKEKLVKQYNEYRKKRGGILLALIFSSLFAIILLFYEALPLIGIEFGGILEREDYFFAYLLIGMQIMILSVIPASKYLYDSFRRLFSFGIDAYVVAGLSAVAAFVYDLVVIFEINDIPPTFHFCVALIIVLAEISTLTRINADIRNYEYYFSEYIYDNNSEDDLNGRKYTLVKSEGRGSLAEKMYSGGLDPKKVIYAPQKINSANGFFKANSGESKKNKLPLSWIILSLAMALMFSIASGIIYEKMWIAMVAFMVTFYMMVPFMTLIAEWLPFGKISKDNYSYGAAFASETSIEKYSNCDIYVFSDLHLFEKCEAKNVNLAIYDSTPKAVLLTCLNSVYSEIEGPLMSAFANVKVQQTGKCKINRIARGGVEAKIGANYSVLIGNEEFMLRYGVVFPSAALGNEEDKIFTLCVSVNGRATARVAARYKLNQTFLNIAEKLAEDNISCAVETYDPMINAEMLAHLRKGNNAPINVIHKNASDHAKERNEEKEGALISALGDEVGVLAHRSRLDLAVAVSNAKKFKKLRMMFNIFAGVFIGMGGIIALMFLVTESLPSVNQLHVLLYWIVSLAATVGIMIWKFPKKDRFKFKTKKDRK